MKHLNTFVMSMGSNENSAMNFLRAKKLLDRWLPNLSYSTPMTSCAYGYPDDANPFKDIIIIGYTSLSRQYLGKRLKEIETLCGRKRKGFRSNAYCKPMPIDIDILIWNGIPVKIKDLHRPYVIKGLHNLGIKQYDKLIEYITMKYA